MTQSHSQNPDQYLILHKVRGEPQFDVAEKTLIGDEEGWVLCTCGHRAYPFWHRSMDDILRREMDIRPIPKDWPDHYDQHTKGFIGEGEFNIFDVVARMIPKMKRRI